MSEGSVHAILLLLHMHKNSTDQDYVTSDSDGLVPSDGSHMGSVSVDTEDRGF